MVEPQVRCKLLDLNRSFYRHFARQFADSRSTAQASLCEALSAIADGMTVLDVGCGDGRVARALEQMGHRVQYVGLDASEPLIALARTRAETLTHVTAHFVYVDVTELDWPSALPRRAFDVILALALLHHIPGRDLRQRTMQQMASLLAPSGTLIISTWQFVSSERLRRNIVPWAAVGLDERQVDPGDYLLSWKRGGYGLRYCCLIGEKDLRDLCQSVGLSISSLFLADKGLNLYATARVCR